jgi:hypothetical protein
VLATLWGYDDNARGLLAIERVNVGDVAQGGLVISAQCVGLDQPRDLKRPGHIVLGVFPEPDSKEEWM